MIRYFMVLLLSLAVFSAAWAPAAEADPLVVLQGRLQATLAAMDQGLASAAQRLAQDGINGPQASQTLARLCADNQQAIDCAAIDPQGVMVVLEPAHFKSFEGTSVANQPQVITALRERRPVLSEYFYTAEGVGAVDLEHPVLTAKGASLGSVSVIFDPARMVERLAGDLALPPGAKLYLAQGDGRLLYSSEAAEIGRNLRGDPLYAQNQQIRAVVERILDQERGESEAYRYRDVSGVEVRRQSRWLSLGLHGVSWRLGLALPVN